MACGSVRFDADHGFFLNEKPLKIQGTCNHQDHAGVGAAVPDRLQAFRIGVLQQMGCNAVRTSHNMPTPELVEACDRMGMMMMCETRQMSSSPEGLAQLETMIKRYRNSPSIILWSIGNEEWHLQNDMAEQGAKIAATMVRRCHELDPTRVVSAAVNGDNAKGVSDALDIIGFNYNLKFPDDFHKKHPTKPVYGSETASTISTRGVYQTDPLRNTLSAYDVNHTDWSELAEEWWKFYGTREWVAGGFAWTGFDYRGEPTPYGWPSINSNFGIVDMCGFPKDNFFYYKAWWTKQPVLHLFPHWNWEGREGDEIPVWVHSNLDEVELLLNGKSQGRQKVPQLGHVEWKVRYEPGSITAHGWKDGKLALTEERTTTGPAVALKLAAERAEIDADGEDVGVLTVVALDSAGPRRADGRHAGRLQGYGRRRADRRGQRRSELPGERQGAAAIALQRSGAGDRAIDEDGGDDRDCGRSERAARKYGAREDRDYDEAGAAAADGLRSRKRTVRRIAPRLEMQRLLGVRIESEVGSGFGLYLAADEAEIVAGARLVLGYTCADR